MNEQYSADYDVRMRTPVGIRLGHMTVCRNLGKVSGFLDILNHSEPFEGIIDHDGNCELSGKMITLMRTIRYVATGRITPDSLTLSVRDERNVFEMTGTPCHL